MSDEDVCSCDGSRGCLSCALERAREARRLRDESQEREAEER